MKKKRLLTNRSGELHEELEAELAKVLQEEIDREILFDMLHQSGWTKIVLPNKFLPVSGIELHKWREQNLKGKWQAHEAVWMFEKPEDAVVFSLKWV